MLQVTANRVDLTQAEAALWTDDTSITLEVDGQKVRAVVESALSPVRKQVREAKWEVLSLIDLEEEEQKILNRWNSLRNSSLLTRKRVIKDAAEFIQSADQRLDSFIKISKSTLQLVELGDPDRILVNEVRELAQLSQDVATKILSLAEHFTEEALKGLPKDRSIETGETARVFQIAQSMSKKAFAKVAFVQATVSKVFLASEKVQTNQPKVYNSLLNIRPYITSKKFFSMSSQEVERRVSQVEELSLQIIENEEDSEESLKVSKQAVKAQKLVEMAIERSRLVKAFSWRSSPVSVTELVDDPV